MGLYLEDRNPRKSDVIERDGSAIGIAQSRFTDGVNALWTLHGRKV